MGTSYKTLWKLLIEKSKKKKDLEKKAQLSHYTMDKFAHGGDLAKNILAKKSKIFNCKPHDIVEVAFEAEEDYNNATM